MGLGSIFFEFAAVSYNAMLHQVSTPANIGRVSAFGWSMGYFGGIVLLLICYVGFIAPDVGWFGVTSEDGLNIRMVALFAAAWFGIFAIPVLLAVPEMPALPSAKRVGFFASYRVLFRDLRSCTAAARTPFTSSGRARCSGTDWPRCSPSAPSWPSRLRDQLCRRADFRSRRERGLRDRRADRRTVRRPSSVRRP